MPPRKPGPAGTADDGATAPRGLPALLPVLRKALAANSRPTEATFPELPAVLFWLRALLGLLLGAGLGAGGPAAGAAALLNGANGVCFLPLLYCTLYLGLPLGTAEYGGAWALLLAGTAPALALALLVWIYRHTAGQEEALRLLGGLLLNATAPEAAAAAPATTATDGATPAGAGDHEF